jgi:high-affinity iron transporter
MGSHDLSSTLSGPLKTDLDIAIFFLAAFFLTTMVVWMRYHGKTMSRDLSERVSRILDSGEHWALFLLSFFGVFREGLETILFLWGIVTQMGDRASLPVELSQGILGLVAGVGLVVVLFTGLLRIPLHLFFSTTSFLLILFAAGMISAGVGRLVMIGALPPLISQIWDTSRILSEHNLMGGFMADFFGYRARPSLIVVLTTFSYMAIMVFWWFWSQRETFHLRPVASTKKRRMNS